jgi:parvulin-like peptidyl-prolyl isomerase
MVMPRRLPSLSLLLFLALLSARPSGLRADTLNKVVLRINDQIATLFDYQQRRQDFLRDLSRREMDAAERGRVVSQAPEIVFKDMFQDLLLDSRAHQLAIEIGEAQVTAAVAQMRQNFGIKTDEDFQQALAQSGMTEAQLREQLRGQLRVREVMDREVRSRVKVDEEALRRYYRKNVEQFRVPEQFHLREVVVLDEGGLPSPGERRAVADQIRQAVAAGKPLAEASAKYRKKGVTSAEVDLGWVSPGDLDPALQTAAWKLKPGELSEPVAGRGGLHLLLAAEHRDARVPPFSEVSSVIQNREQDRVYNLEVAKYMVELEQKSLIVLDPPAEAAGFRRLLSKPEEPGIPGLSDLMPPIAPIAPATAAGTAPAPGGKGTQGNATKGKPPAAVPKGSMAEPSGAQPGALPQPKPVDNEPPPVTAAPPAPAPPPPPPAVS